MPKQNLPYKEGTWFVVPLENSGFGVGIIARMTGKGTTFGYFFGPKRDIIPNLKDISTLVPQDAIWKGIFGDLGLFKKKWPILGQSADWNRNKWPLPRFIRVEDTGKSYLVTYDDNLNCVSEERCDPSLVEKYPRDGQSGSGVVEYELTKLLDS